MKTNIIFILLLAFCTGIHHVSTAIAANVIKENTMTDNQKVEAFFEAFSEKNLTQIKQLMEEGVSADIENHEGKTALQIILYIVNYLDGREDIVEYLINQGANIHIVGEFNVTLLHNAVANNSMELVKLLLEKGIDTSVKTDIVGQTAIFNAGTVEMLKFLVELPDFSYQDRDEGGNTLLHSAVKLKPYPVLIEYLSNHIGINAKNNKGNTALMEVVNSLGSSAEEVEVVVNTLLANHGDVNAVDENGRTVFMRTLRNKDLNVSLLDKFVESGADLQHKDNLGLSALHFTAASNLEYMKFLVDKGADLNQVSGEGEQTPLIIAAEYNRPETVKYLLEHKVKLNEKDARGKTALNYALEGDFSHIVMLLNELGAIAGDQDEIEQLDKQTKEKEQTLKQQEKEKITDLDSAIAQKNFEQFKKYYEQELASLEAGEEMGTHRLASFVINVGELEALKYLVEKGLDLQQSKDNNGYTLMHVAVFHNRLEMVKYLLDKGVDIRSAANNGTSVYNMSANSSLEMLNYLLAQGVEENKEEGDAMLRRATGYRNPVMIKYYMNKGYTFDKTVFENKQYLLKTVQYQNTEMLKILLDNGLDIETMLSVYGDMVSLLHFAVMIESESVVSFLLQQGANPDARNSDDKPVYIDAINAGNMEILNALYDHKANLNDVSGVFNETPLAIALKLQRVDIVNMLVDRGADVNRIFGFDKDAALHMAARLGYLQALKNMLEHGGDVTIANGEQKTPLDIAIAVNEPAVVKYLQSLAN